MPGTTCRVSGRRALQDREEASVAFRGHDHLRACRRVVDGHLREGRDRARFSHDVDSNTGEETGLLGSSRITKEPPPGMVMSGLLGMLNMDMIGRLRGNRVAVLGSDSAAEWEELLAPHCDDLKIGCKFAATRLGLSRVAPLIVVVK